MRAPAARRPHPVRDRRVDQQRPQRHEDAQRRELHAVGEGTHDQRRRDDRERHLEHHVDGLRDRRRHRRDVLDARLQHEGLGVVALGDVIGDAVQHEARQVADVGIARREGQAVAGDAPDDGDDAGDDEALHQRGEDVLLAHHAAVEQCQAWDGHQQHQRGAGKHPGGVAGVDLGRAGVVGQGRHRRQQQRQHGGESPGKVGVGSSLWFPLVLSLRVPRHRPRRCGCARRVRCRARRSCRRRSCRYGPTW